MLFSIALGLFDLVLAEAGAALDGDALLFAGGLFLGGDVQDAVGVDVKGHFDLWHATWHRRDSVELEGAERLVVAGHGALALQDHDFHTGLLVGIGGEGLAVLLGDGGIARDHRRGDTASGFDGEGQRSHVEQEHVLHVALEHTALDGSTDGHDFVRVHTLVRVFAGQLAGSFHHLGHAGHAAHEHEFVDLAGVQLGGGQAVAHGLHGALKQAVAELLHLGAGEGLHDVLRPGGVGGDEGQVQVVALAGAEGDLGLLRLFLDALQGVRLAAEVDAAVALEFVHDPGDQRVVPVVTTQVGVAVRGQHFEDAVADFEDGDVEGTTAEVIHGDLFVGLAFKAVGQGGGGGLVDDAAHVQAGDLASGLGGVAL